jgi:hypothetical protein
MIDCDAYQSCSARVRGLMGKAKIMIFTIPNDGHLNILKSVIRRYRSSYDFQLILVDRQNIPPDLSGLTDHVFTLKRSRYFLNTPASRVFQRVYEQLDECVEITREFGPDLIIYDFCALEGHFTANILGIPCWCSIPGLMGPLTDTDYLADSLSSTTNQDAIRSMEQKFGLAIRQADVEVISNSLHIPGEVNLIWSYPSITPPNFLHNRKEAQYRFAGYLSDGRARQDAVSDTPLIYLSFGTEVMDNLWRAEEATRVGVTRLVSGLAERWRSRGVDVVFATQGKSVLDEYPPNWTVRDKVDQQEVLSRTDVFVTHGGSNSFHEAVLFKVPMVVAPFFGDQVLAGKRAEELGIGIDLVEGGGVDKNRSKQFLNAELIDKIDTAVHQILHNDKYRKRFDELTLESTPELTEIVEERR